jgi:hypothetical protein
MRKQEKKKERKRSERVKDETKLVLSQYMGDLEVSKSNFSPNLKLSSKKLSKKANREVVENKKLRNIDETKMGRMQSGYRKESAETCDITVNPRWDTQCGMKCITEGNK